MRLESIKGKVKPTWPFFSSCASSHYLLNSFGGNYLMFIIDVSRAQSAGVKHRVQFLGNRQEDLQPVSSAFIWCKWRKKWTKKTSCRLLASLSLNVSILVLRGPQVTWAWEENSLSLLCFLTPAQVLRPVRSSISLNQLAVIKRQIEDDNLILFPCSCCSGDRCTFFCRHPSSAPPLTLTPLRPSDPNAVNTKDHDYVLLSVCL